MYRLFNKNYFGLLEIGVEELMLKWRFLGDLIYGFFMKVFFLNIRLVLEGFMKFVNGEK